LLPLTSYSQYPLAELSSASGWHCRRGTNLQALVAVPVGVGREKVSIPKMGA
jgi:hypothetical protein